MSVRTDQVNLIVNINGNDAQNKLNDLRKKAADLKDSMIGLKKSTQEYKDKAANLKEVEAAMSSLKKEIGITALSQKELIAELNKLKALKGSVIPFSAEFKQLEKDIRAVENRLYDVRNGVQGFASFFSKIKTEIKQFGLLAVSYLGFQFISSQFQNIVKSAGKLSDSLADIQRIAGLTKNEVEDLNKSFGEIDTRSSTQSLRDIAVVAGKLGIEGKESILSFTKSMDQLTVALGDELGDADSIAETLGKILNVFDGKITGDNISRLGNQFVTLANAGVASADWIADFDQRLAGIAKSANISLGALSGLGAGLQEMGGRTESSATAIQNIINQIAGDIPAAAKAAGVELTKFKQIFETDATEAIILFAEGLQKNASSFPDIIAKFNEADVSGARVIETISKMGTGADMLRDKISLAKNAIGETSQITDAYNLKNQTFGAELDKLGKKIYGIVTSQALQNFAKGTVRAIGGLIDALKALPEWIDRNKTALILLTTALVLSKKELILNSLNTVLNTLAKTKNTIVTTISTAATKGATIATAAYNIVVGLLTGNIMRAGVAMALFNKISKANLIGVIITAVSAAIIVFDTFFKKVETLSNAQRAANAVTKSNYDLLTKANEIYGSVMGELENLKKTVTSTTASYDEKRKALNKLIEINPEFAKTLQLSKDGHLKGAEAIDVYIAALHRKAKAEAAQTMLVEEYKKRNKITIDTQKELRDNFQTTNKWANQAAGDSKEGSVQYNTAFRSGLNALKYKNSKTLQNQKDQLVESDANIKFLNNIISQQGDVTGVRVPGSNSNSTTGNNLSNSQNVNNGTSSNTTQHDKLLDETKQFQKEIEKMKRDAEISGMAIDKQELARVEDKYKELFEKAKKYAISTIELEKLKEDEIEKITTKYADIRKKETDENAYKSALEANDNLENERKQNAANDFADGKTNKQQYENELTQIELTAQKARWEIAQQYAALVTDANKDELKEKRKYEHEKTQAIIKENENRKAFNDSEKLAKANTNVLKQVKGSRGELDAKKALLEAQFALETEMLDKTSNMYLEKEAIKNEQLTQLETDFVKAKIDQYAQYAQYISSSLESLNQIINNKNEKELQKEKRRNEYKKTSYKKQLDSKLISQEQYNQMVEAADAELDKKTKELQKEQAKREKALRLFNAVISVAQGVAASLAYGGPVGIAMAIATGIAGALQIAAISSAPLPEFGKGEWVRKGDKHSDPSGGINAKIERDEAVINAAAMNDKDVLTVTGTTAQITSALNARTGGTSWMHGAKVVKLNAFNNAQPRYIQPQLPLIMASGGTANTLQNNASGDTANTLQNNEALLLQSILQELENNTQEIKTMKTRLKAIVSIKEIKETEDLYNNAKKASGF